MNPFDRLCEAIDVTNRDPIYVDTEMAIAFLLRDGVTAKEARRAIYSWHQAKRIKNYGGTGPSKAVWDLWEIKAALILAGGPNGYIAAHRTVREERGKASDHECSLCYVVPAQDWAHLDGPGWSGDVDRYGPMCRSCHVDYDRGFRYPA